MVSAISPGVLGTTGIETVEILKGIVENIHPKLVIVIDALASRSIERISSTVQLSDTGIVPGAGVGNTRSEISQKTLGVPVVAIRNSNRCRNSSSCKWFFRFIYWEITKGSEIQWLFKSIKRRR